MNSQNSKFDILTNYLKSAGLLWALFLHNFADDFNSHNIVIEYMSRY